MKYWLFTFLVTMILLGACSKENSRQDSTTIYGTWEWASPRQNGDLIRLELHADSTYSMLVQSDIDGNVKSELNKGFFQYDYKTMIFHPMEKPVERMDYVFLRRDEMEITNVFGEKYFFKRKKEDVKIP